MIMKITSQKTTNLLMTFAIVLLLICSVHYHNLYVSYRDSYVHEALEATENMLKIDKDLSQQSSDDLKARVDKTLDWYLWQLHRLSQNPKLIDDKNHFDRVVKMALDAGYDLSGEELTGLRGEDFEAYY